MPDTATQTLADFLLARFDVTDSGRRFLHPAFAQYVLLDLDAKRHIVELWREARDWMNTEHDDEFAAQECGLAAALVLLAQPYADHPAFRTEWRLS